MFEIFSRQNQKKDGKSVRMVFVYTENVGYLCSDPRLLETRHRLSPEWWGKSKVIM